MNYRHLTEAEINTLLSQNCYATDWTKVSVTSEFSPENIINTRFDGTIKLGDCTGTIDSGKDKPVRCGIYNSFLTNCEIGSHVYISDVRYLSNYRVETNVVISNTGSVSADKESGFGNGTEIEVLNEGGGRELPIFDSLSSQIAYLTVLYRHDKEFTDRLLGIIKDYCVTKISTQGTIESGVKVLDSQIIRNVFIGSFSTISGTSLLEDGTIRSCPEAPVYIGTGVTAKKFIVLSGSQVDSNAVLDKCFVGQGVRIGKQFSAENSVFFANSEGFHGEACSLFAGPYSVTHHKSTLLIACLVSFFNAGSGTNQSNHMYKLGPVHQGILERGSKTGSFSYLLLPCHIGAFTVVVGKHYANFDTSDFPFSYITEDKGKSELTPAMNLFTVGTRRDIDKWPARDRRKDPEKLDLIHFGLFNPWIVEKILNGIKVLDELIVKASQKLEYVSYKGINIRRLLLKTTRKYYEIALKVYVGQEIVKRIGHAGDHLSLTEIKNLLRTGSPEGSGKWVEICGMFAPATSITGLISQVKAGKIRTIDELNENLRSIYSSYEDYAWTWCANLIKQMTGHYPEDIPFENLILLISEWKENSVKLNSMILKDAEKEFDHGSKIGFGIDGDADIRDRDFNAVRGVYDKNKFIISLKRESEIIEKEAERLIGLLAASK